VKPEADLIPNMRSSASAEQSNFSSKQFQVKITGGRVVKKVEVPEIVMSVCKAQV